MSLHLNVACILAIILSICFWIQVPWAPNCPGGGGLKKIPYFLFLWA